MKIILILLFITACNDKKEAMIFPKAKIKPQDQYTKVCLGAQCHCVKNYRYNEALPVNCKDYDEVAKRFNFKKAE